MGLRQRYARDLLALYEGLVDEEEAPLLTRSGMGMQLVREGSRDAASADAASAGAASGPADAEEN